MRGLIGVGVAACIGCSSSSGGNAPASTGDGGTVDAGSNNTLTCGKGTVTGVLRAVDPNGIKGVAAATVTAPGCNTATTDDRGYLNVASDPTFLVKLDVTATGYVHEHSDFYALASNYMGNGYVYETSITSQLPGWSSSMGYVAVVVSAGGMFGACATVDGVTLSIKGHPEVTAVYLSDPLTVDKTLKATNTLGLGAIGPIAPGSYEIDAAKTGCTSAATASTYTRFATTPEITAGAVTLQALQLQ